MAKSKEPDDRPDPKAFERMTEFTRRIVAVPKSELPKKRKHKSKDRRSG
jgi:hypothetical protein